MPPSRLWLCTQRSLETKAWASTALPLATLPPQGSRPAPGTQAGLGLGGSVPKHRSCPATCRPPPQAPTPWTLFPSAAGRLVTPPPCSGPGGRTATQTGEVGRCLRRSKGEPAQAGSRGRRGGRASRALRPEAGEGEAGEHPERSGRQQGKARRASIPSAQATGNVHALVRRCPKQAAGTGEGRRPHPSSEHTMAMVGSCWNSSNASLGTGGEHAGQQASVQEHDGIPHFFQGGRPPPCSRTGPFISGPSLGLLSSPLAATASCYVAR